MARRPGRRSRLRPPGTLAGTRIPPAAAVVLLLALAGCGAQPVPPVSPVPVPADTTDGGDAADPVDGAGTTDASARSVAPGLTETGVTDPLRLSYAHDAVVRNASVTATLERVRRYRNGSVFSAERRRVAASADRVRVSSTLAERGLGATYFPDGGSAEFWTNGTRYLQYLDRDGSVTYGGVPADRYAGRARTDLPLVPGGGRVLVLFDGLDVRVVGTDTVDGRRVYRLAATAAAAPPGLAAAEGVRDVRDLSLTATVDDRGVLRSYRLEYVAVADTRLDVVTTGTYDRVGSTTIERPDWYDEALQVVEGRDAGNATVTHTPGTAGG